MCVKYLYLKVYQKDIITLSLVSYFLLSFSSLYKQPQLRPKGLGLGADKVVKSNQKQKTAKDSKGEDLTIVKNAYVKINTGKYSGYYGKVIYTLWLFYYELFLFYKL